MKTLLALAILMLAAVAAFPADVPLTGGKGTLYVGVRPNKILIIDEATEKVTGSIDLKTGIPIGMSLSKNKKHFYIFNTNLETIEVVDIASRKSIDSFTLSEDGKHVRIRGWEVDPLERFVMLVTRTATKKEDRWEIGPNVLQQYDLKEHKIMRTIPWPKNEEREFVGMAFSPDGKYMYMFGDDILIYDTTDFKEVDKWELSRPLEDGFGRINFGNLDDTYEEPGYYTGIFTVNDAVQNRRIMGIARVNLGKKSVEFYALGPATGVSFALTPDRKRAYGLHQEVGRYEFWTFDLDKREVHSKVEFDGRPRMGLKTSSNGKVLYIYIAGNTIDLYDAATLKYLRTITLDADTSTGMYVMMP